MIWVFTQAAKIAALDQDVVSPAAVGPWFGAKIRLYTNTIVLSAQTILTDLIIPTWTGYADSGAITWLTATGAPSGAGELLGDTITFTSGSDANDVIKGIAIKTSGGDLICAANLDVGLNIVGVMNVVVVPKLVIA